MTSHSPTYPRATWVFPTQIRTGPQRPYQEASLPASLPSWHLAGGYSLPACSWLSDILPAPPKDQEGKDRGFLE